MWPCISSGKLTISAGCGVALPTCCALSELFPCRKYWMRSVIRSSSCIWLASSVPTGVRSSRPSPLVHVLLLRSTTVSWDVLLVLETGCGLVSSQLVSSPEAPLNVATLRSSALGPRSLLKGLAMIRHRGFSGIVVAGSRSYLDPAQFSLLRT